MNKKISLKYIAELAYGKFNLVKNKKAVETVLKGL